jgi:predicted MarR family transcription regulator
MTEKSKKKVQRKKQPIKIEDIEINWEGPRRIVSSAHLVSERSPESSEFEFAMILAVNSFNRWVVRCMTAAGVKDLSTLEVLLLHHVHHRARKKKLADICFMYNIEDTHVVLYTLNKLAEKGLVDSEKSESGKEMLYFTTALGAEVIERYRQMREHCLISLLSKESDESYKLGEMAEFLRYLAAQYDQAARAATSL